METAPSLGCGDNLFTLSGFKPSEQAYTVDENQGASPRSQCKTVWSTQSQSPVPRDSSCQSENKKLIINKLLSALQAQTCQSFYIYLALGFVLCTTVWPLNILTQHWYCSCWSSSKMKYVLTDFLSSKSKTYTQMLPVKLMWGHRWGLHITATTAICSKNTSY